MVSECESHLYSPSSIPLIAGRWSLRRTLCTTFHAGPSSHAYYRHVLYGGFGGDLMSSLLLLDRRWCDSGGRQAVWDVCLWCLLQSIQLSRRRYQDKGWWYIRLQRRLYALRWKHKIYDQTMSTRVCFVSLLKVVDWSLALGMRIHSSTLC